MCVQVLFFFFSSRRRHTRYWRDWSSDVCSSDLVDQLRAGHELAQDLGVQLISNQPQYSMLWRVIEGEVVPTSEELGVSLIVFSPIAQGVLTGKYRPGEELPAGARGADGKGRARVIPRVLTDSLPERVHGLRPIARRP